jgi:hypothetical protein
MPRLLRGAAFSISVVRGIGFSFPHPEEPLKTASRRARENAQRLSSSFDKLRMRGKRGDRIMLKVTKFQLKGRAECLRRGFFIKQAND